MSAAALAVSAAIPASSRDARVRVSILSSSQRLVLRESAVRVRVSVRRAAVVRLGALGSPVRTVRFRRAGSRVVPLRLGAGLRRALAGCGRHRVVVRAGRVRAARTLAPDPARCSSSSPATTSPSNPARGSSATSSSGGAETPAEPPMGPPIEVEGADDPNCDFLDPSMCLLPWPNDRFTVADTATETDRRLNLSPLAMPRNSAGKPIDPSDMNRGDGFSPGNMIVTRVPGLDNPQAFERTGAVPITDMARYADADQPVVVIDASTGQRHPIWSEIDSVPGSESAPGGDEDRNLIIRPAVNFEEGHRYVVALRNLRDGDGKLIPAGNGFLAYRDRRPTDQPEVEERREHFEGLFKSLAAAGIARQDLYLAWDFTVASRQSLTGRMLKIRDDAFAQLGDTNLADLTVQGEPPPITVDDYEDFPTGKIARQVQGRITVPCYLNAPGCPAGATFPINPQSGELLLEGGQVNRTEARFTCRIPRTALAPGNNARPSLYGHGLFGDRAEVRSGAQTDFAGDHNLMLCATDWIGMACSDLPDVPPTPEGFDDFDYPTRLAAWLEEQAREIGDGSPPPYPPNCDLPVTLTALQDLSNFPKLADRVQQGMLNFLYLGRAMIHPDGFSKQAAFKRPGGSSLIDTTRLFYDGNSQGGIIGGALAAVAVDHDRAVLGVPGMNYSTLLSRSVDFDAYAKGEFLDEMGPAKNTPLGLYDNYTEPAEYPLIFSLMQLLWDRAEANGYALHMTDDPLPNTPPHNVMLHVAHGDHQVANVAAEVEARTIGARAIEPYLDAGRSPYSTSTPWGIPAIQSFPFGGSAIVHWDSGSPTAPTTNLPPREGTDPHSHPRSTPIARAMKSAFLQVGGQVVNTCAPGPCYANGYHP